MNKRTFQERADEFSKEIEAAILPIVVESGVIELDIRGMKCTFEVSSDKSKVLVSTGMAKRCLFSEFPLTPQVLFADAIIKAAQ